MIVPSLHFLELRCYWHGTSYSVFSYNYLYILLLNIRWPWAPWKPQEGLKHFFIPLDISAFLQFSSVAQSCLTLCDPMDWSMPGLPVHHQLQEFTQTHVHWVGDAIQPSHPVIPFSSRLQSFLVSGSFPMSQFFASGSQSIGVSDSTSVLPMNIQDWFPLGWTGLISLQSKGLSRVFSDTTVQKYQFLCVQHSL